MIGNPSTLLSWSPTNSRMAKLDLLIGYFNIVLGIIASSIGFKIYKPFRADKAEEMERKFGTFYKVGGIALVIWGLLKIF